MSAALKARLDSLGKMKALPEGIDQANLDYSRQVYDELSNNWAGAQEDFAAGRITEAASKANAARRRANDMFPRQFIALARAKEGIVFGSPDMGKTNLFFLLALRNDTLHLRWLSRLAWIVRSPGRLARLVESATADAMLEALLEGADSLPASLRPTGQTIGGR